MLYKDLDDLYQPRRIPWLPIMIGVALVGLGLLYLLRGSGENDAVKSPPAPVEEEIGHKDGEAFNRTVPAPQKPLPGTTPDTRVPYPAEALNRILAESRTLEEQGDLNAAREQLLALLEDGRSLGAQQVPVEQRLGALNIALATSIRPMPGKISYVIQPNDSLSKIATKFNCPVELIQKANRIANPRLIRPGNVLHLLDRPEFSIEISKRNNTLLLLLGGRFFKRYSVGTGEFGRTPTGTFLIRDKIAEPPWWHPDGKVIPFGDPENILGTRWLAIEATGKTPPVSGYGIHGTWDESTIGKAASAGCIRMRNTEVEELHMLVPRGTPVVIRD